VSVTVPCNRAVTSCETAGTTPISRINANRNTRTPRLNPPIMAVVLPFFLTPAQTCNPERLMSKPLNKSCWPPVVGEIVYLTRGALCQVWGNRNIVPTDVPAARTCVPRSHPSAMVRKAPVRPLPPAPRRARVAPPASDHERFHYLHYGLSAVLVFVGAKIVAGRLIPGRLIQGCNRGLPLVHC